MTLTIHKHVPSNHDPVSATRCNTALCLYCHCTADTEPYRLYNLDVFEYLHESPFGLYGAIPVMVAHKLGLTTGVFWCVGFHALGHIWQLVRAIFVVWPLTWLHCDCLSHVVLVLLHRSHGLGKLQSATQAPPGNRKQPVSKPEGHTYASYMLMCDLAQLSYFSLCAG